MASQQHTKWVSNPNVVASTMGSSLALLDLHSDRYYSLNNTGATVWGLLETPKTLPDLCSAVSKKYQVPPESCRDDIVEILTSLQNEGLIDGDGYGKGA